MAVPTLTDISPAAGHPGGKQLVTITGTGFELPPAPPATGYVGGAAPDSVEVEFDGQPATDVQVWTDTLMTCLVPAYTGDPTSLTATPGYSVDVVIRNVVGAEEATFADAYAYQRTNLARADGPLQHVLRRLVRDLKRQVIQEVAFATTVDYDGDTVDTLDIVELAQIPAIALFGPDIQENRFERTNEKSVDRNVGQLEFSKYRFPRVADLGFDATLTARSMGEYLQLANELVEFFHRNPLLVVDKDSQDAAAGVVEFDMFLTAGPTRGGAANTDDVYSGTASFVIRGVPIDADEAAQIQWGQLVENTDEAVQVTTEEL